MTDPTRDFARFAPPSFKHLFEDEPMTGERTFSQQEARDKDWRDNPLLNWIGWIGIVVWTAWMLYMAIEGRVS